MRIRTPLTMSALVVAGMVSAGSTATQATPVPAALRAAPVAQPAGPAAVVGLLPDSPVPVADLGSAVPEPALPKLVPLSATAISAPGGLGIPEVVLAAYRNAELALGASQPGCGLNWSLLAGIGRIESGHASGGRTDASGTTATPIFGPSLDGHLPGNEVIRNPDNTFVRAIGPMQFLPGTWRRYAADGNADGTSDPHNVFDAALAAGKYLCSGGLDLRDPAQELRAVLRYNNSLSYAQQVLGWAQAYRTGGAPADVKLLPGVIPPGPLPDIRAAKPGQLPEPADKQATAPALPQVVPAPPPMITIPGLPPIPCGIFCPQPLNPAPGAPQHAPADSPAPAPAPAPMPGLPAIFPR